MTPPQKPKWYEYVNAFLTAAVFIGLLATSIVQVVKLFSQPDGTP